MEELPQLRREWRHGPLQFGGWERGHPASSKKARQQGGLQRFRQPVNRRGRSPHRTEQQVPAQGAPLLGQHHSEAGIATQQRHDPLAGHHGGLGLAIQ